MDRCDRVRRLGTRRIGDRDDPEQPFAARYEDRRGLRTAGEQLSGNGDIVSPHERAVADQHQIPTKHRVDAEAWGVAETLWLPEDASERPGMRNNRLAQWVLRAKLRRSRGVQ